MMQTEEIYQNHLARQFYNKSKHCGPYKDFDVFTQQAFHKLQTQARTWQRAALNLRKHYD